MRLPGLEVVSWRGAGPPTLVPLVLLHGAWHGAWCWGEGFAARLASRGHDVHALSLRGHGGSEGGGSLWRARIKDYVTDLRQVTDGLDRPAVLIGHSMGAFVVQKHLETGGAAGAVLLAPMPHFGIAACMARLLAMAPRAVLRMHASLGILPVAPTPAIARRLFFSSRMPEDVVLRHQARLQGEAFLAYLDMLGFDLCRPKRGAVPMLVLGAANDRMFTRGEVEAVAAAHGADVAFFASMAHDIMLEAGWPDVADRIADWAGRLGSGDESAPVRLLQDTP